jgi:hypothetical protein
LHGSNKSEFPFIARWLPCGTQIFTGVSNVLNPSSMEVYPNPSNGKFLVQVKNEGITTNNIIEVYNILGEKVYSQPSIPNSSFSINLAGFSAGIYLVRVYNPEQKFIATTKIVIE